MQFKEVLKENKERKHLLGSGEKVKKKEDQKKMKSKLRDRWKLHENLKFGDYLPIKFEKLSIFKML